VLEVNQSHLKLGVFQNITLQLDKSSLGVTKAAVCHLSWFEVNFVYIDYKKRS